ncbi:hypothetical protein D1816_12065 [Aquimarina sp. AD10]|nr:hypothetical protein D1816_12065 [Aquimarina sp. AD10]RKM91646.1 hypothetical protein D7033_21915 [Aquimarina sp. AD10]
MANPDATTEDMHAILSLHANTKDILKNNFINVFLGYLFYNHKPLYGKHLNIIISILAIIL